MPEIGDTFTPVYGDKRYEKKGDLVVVPGGTPLIASGARRNGVYGIFNIPATKEHVLSVARTGSAGAAFYHGYPCEISCDALVLTPKVTLKSEEMLWFASAINLNRFRFNFGRKVTPDRIRVMRVPELPNTLPSVAEVAFTALCAVKVSF